MSEPLSSGGRRPGGHDFASLVARSAASCPDWDALLARSCQAMWHEHIDYWLTEVRALQIEPFVGVDP